jgi:hypothetical protein
MSNYVPVAFMILIRHNIYGQRKTQLLFAVCMFLAPTFTVYALHPEQVNMSLIVHDSEAKALVEALHQAFFQDDVLAQVEAENLLAG